MQFNKIWNIARLFPEIFPYMCGILMLGSTSIILMTLVLLCYFSLICNIILKLLFSWFYKILNVKTLPILGRGLRPEESIHCGTFSPSCGKYKDIQELKKQLNFGMPSGHATCVFTVGFFLLLLIWKNEQGDEDEDEDKKELKLHYTDTPFGIQNCTYVLIIKIIQTLIISSLIIMICYSRVYIEKCHTYQQVIMGGLIGVGTAYLYSVYDDYIINVIQNNSKLHIRLYFGTLLLMILSIFVN